MGKDYGGGSPKLHQQESKRKRVVWIIAVTCLCMLFYFLGAWQNTNLAPVLEASFSKLSDEASTISVIEPPPYDTIHVEWLSRATNWAKFCATAELGVIHRGHLLQGRSLMAPYLPEHGAVGSSPYSEADTNDTRDGLVFSFLYWNTSGMLTIHKMA